MNIVLNVAELYPQGMILECGKGIQFALDHEKLEKLLGHANVLAHAIHKGLENIVKDTHAGVKKDDYALEEDWKQASRNKAEVKLGALMDGELRIVRSGGETVDRFTAMARKIVRELLPKEKRKEFAQMVKDDRTAEVLAQLDEIFANNDEALGLTAKVNAAIIAEDEEEAAKNALAAKIKL